MTASASTLSALRRFMMLFLVLGLMSVSTGRTASAVDTTAPPELGNELGILGDKLQIWVDEQLKTYTYHYLDEIVEERLAGFYGQYQSPYTTTLRFDKGQGRVVHGTANSPFTSLSHVTEGTSTIVTTVTTDGGNLQIVHTVTYNTGDHLFKHTWVVTNNSSSQPYSDVALRYGGNTAFNGDYYARGAYDATTKYLYCFADDDGRTGTMGFQPDVLSAADSYLQGEAGIVSAAMEGTGDLTSSTVEVDDGDTQTGIPDSAMAVEWRYGALAPNGSFTVSLYEKWTSEGELQVFAPAPITVQAGASTSVTFSIRNLLGTKTVIPAAAPVTLDFYALPPEGWLEYAVSPLTITLNDGESHDVVVDLTIPSGWQSGANQVQLNVENNNEFVQGATTIVNVSGEVEPPPVVVTLPNASSLPLSSATETVYTAINPSTTQGIDSVLAALSGRSSSITRAFAWHTHEGRYVEIPAQADQLPDGVVVETGIFIATRRRLNYDLSGSPVDVSYYSQYQLTIPAGTDAVGIPTGWTFAGLPPIKLDADFTQTQYYYWPGAVDPPSDATPLEILINNEPASDEDLILIMGDGDVEGSIDSSRPWAWNASANRYEQTALLRIGQAYWFKNNSTTQDVVIQVSGSQRQVAILHSKKQSSKLTTSTVQRANLKNRGTPPPMPGSGAGKGTGKSASSGGGCGSGSGLGLFSLLLFLFGLRFLVVVRR